ncbi:lysylphosphatidylglycerol synthase domain-containing protein [Plantactinospora sp. KLBMP9567]|uniref:lysylphosphatidylglycerol synthase domain-containing protein n=1 Tax=Plantactinospora sp. KLBMP9567 TaxID=3085900 RepID=UPI002981A6E4|nr:lysylphosphatidylglycerol synthase domain-containing protein [Plantactinospora sp. KLBMP9567]MDW5324602.1 lysylphosphatidylglycerol synthase domain-containing protein [Plantactinospora sp. KLBMP9567]
MPRATGRWSLVRRIAQVAVTTAFLGLVGWSVASRWDEVPAVLDELSVSGLLLAGLAAVAGALCGCLAWRAILADFGAELPLGGAARIFFVGQLAKYLPGKVWPILVQARLGRAYGVPGRASAAAALLAMLVTLGTGLLLTAVALPVLGDRAVADYWWVLLAVPPALLVLWPPLVNRILAALLRLARREPMPRPLSLRGIRGAVGWSLATWLGYGTHLWLLLADVGAGGPDLLLRSIGAFAGSWSVGFLLAVAPAGVGPREVALPLLLGPTVAGPTALVATVLSRLLLTLVDLLLPAVAISVQWSGRRLSGRLPGRVDGFRDAPAVTTERADGRTARYAAARALAGVRQLRRTATSPGRRTRRRAPGSR